VKPTPRGLEPRVTKEGVTVPDETIPVLLDTDIGTNIDDALALAYLLRQPRCELLGVTTVTGDVGRRAEVVAAVCRASGRPFVPVHCGARDPLLFGPGQPDVPLYEAIGHRADGPRLTGRALPAPEFLRRMIRARPGTALLTIGPLTNVATLLALDPEVASSTGPFASMAGVFVPHGRRSETNTRVDPVAAAIVYRTWERINERATAPASRHVSIGLDVTSRCTLPADEARAKLAKLPGPVREMLDLWLRTRDHVPFHDALAAATLFRPGLCTYADGRVTVDARPDSPDAGRTTFTPGPGHHRVATGVDVAGFFEEYFSVFA
jgi:purine nucleosidase